MGTSTDLLAFSFEGAMTSSIILNWLVFLALAHFICMFNSLQIIVFQTMMNLEYPGNAQMLAYAIIQVINIEILSPELIYNLLGLDFEGDEAIMEELDDRQIKTMLIR